MYERAVNNVKLYCPGFTKSVNNELYNSESDESTNMLLNTVVAILTGNNHSADGILDVAKGDELACRMHFPVYDTDFGCKIYDGASVKDAICYDNGTFYELVILFQEQSTVNGISEEFANMMIPFSDEALLYNLNAYFPSLNEDNCIAELRYYNCEIRCELDKTNGHVLSLKHKLIADVSMILQLDFIFTEPSVEAQATMINHLAFTDFIWN